MGAMVPVIGADVVLLQSGKVVDKTTSDEDGYYSFNFLIPGEYNVEGSKKGFRTNIIKSVPAVDDEVTKNDLYLSKFNGTHVPKFPKMELYNQQ